MRTKSNCQKKHLVALSMIVFYMSGNPESKTSLLDVMLGVEYFSRQRAPAGHSPLPPHLFFLKSDFGIPLSLRNIIFFTCLEVDVFSISFLNIKNRGATAPPTFQLICPEKLRFFLVSKYFLEHFRQVFWRLILLVKKRTSPCLESVFPF